MVLREMCEEAVVRRYRKQSHDNVCLQTASGMVSSLKEVCEMFAQNRPLSLAASQTLSQFTSLAIHTD